MCWGGGADSESLEEASDVDVADKGKTAIATATSPRKATRQRQLFLFGEVYDREVNEALAPSTSPPKAKSEDPTKSPLWEAVTNDNVEALRGMTDDALSVRNIQEDTVYHVVQRLPLWPRHPRPNVRHRRRLPKGARASFRTCWQSVRSSRIS